MTPSRRLLLLGLIFVGTQLTGCYCCRPYLFPRLQLCGQGPCGAAPVYPVAAGGVAVGPVVASTGGYNPGCVGCGSAGGIPIADAGQVYHGAPIATTPAPAGAPSTPLGFPGGSVPMNMPGGGVSYGGIPFDSALNPPTVTPPTAAKKLDVPADGRKIVTAGK